MRIKVLIAAVTLVVSSVAALANHHSFSAYFDSQKPFSVTGTIVKVDWVDPAVFVHLRVVDSADGQAAIWAFEGESVKAMERRGLSRQMFREGDVVTAVGWMGRPGANLSETVRDPELAARVRAERTASIAQFEFADGRKVPVVGNVPTLPTRN